VKRRAAGGALLLLAWSGSARAHDPKSQDVTVQAWTGAKVVFTPDSKALTAGFQQWVGSALQVFGQVSAPLDTDSRVAAFLSSNRVVGGFGGQLQIGFDTRARRVRLLRDYLAAVRAPVRALLAIPAEVRDVDKMQDIKSRNVCDRPGSQGCLADGNYGDANAICTAPAKPGWPASPLPKDQRILAWACATYGVDRCSVEAAVARIPAFQAATCAGAPARAPGDALACEYAGAALSLLRSSAALCALQRIPNREATATEVLKIYAELDPAKAAPLQARRAAGAPAWQVMVDNQADIARAFDDLDLTQPALTLRDIQLTGDHAGRARPDWILVLAGAVSYDRLDVYVGSADAAAQVPYTKYDVQAGLDLTEIFGANWSWNARVGWERSRVPNAQALDRCTAVMSADSGVAARTCDANALYLDAAPEGGKNQAYARVALAKLFMGAADAHNKVIPGVELRAAAEGLGQDTVLAFRAGFFLTPAIGSSAVRVGVALQLDWDVHGELDPDTHRKWDVVPFAFLGATSTLLGGN
jgi:hypothetical protein